MLDAEDGCARSVRCAVCLMQAAAQALDGLLPGASRGDQQDCLSAEKGEHVSALRPSRIQFLFLRSALSH